MPTEGDLGVAIINAMAEQQTRVPLYKEVERLQKIHPGISRGRVGSSDDFGLIKIVRKELEDKKGDYQHVGAQNGYDVYARSRNIVRNNSPIFYADYTTIKSRGVSLPDISHFTYLADRSSRFDDTSQGFLKDDKQVIEGITTLLDETKGCSPIRDYVGVASAIVLNGLAWYLHDPNVQNMTNHNSISHWGAWTIMTMLTVVGGASLASAISKQSERKLIKDTKKAFHHTQGWEAIQQIAKEIKEEDHKN